MNTDKITSTFNTLTAKGAKTPERLLEDALSAFTAAEKKLVIAEQQIQAQATELTKQREVIDVKLESAASAVSRLQRIRERVAGLLA